MKVTIITTVLNQADALSVTMQSVLEQARPNLDYIVIDGGSVDGTIDVIQAQADRLKYWLSEPDTGIYEAMNKGWTLADADSWLLFLGAGDKLITLPDGNRSGEDLFETLFGNVQLDDGQVFHAHSGFRLKLYNSLHHQGLLIPKYLHPEPPFDLSYPLYADFDFNQRLSKQGVAFRFEPKLSAYAAPGGLTKVLQLPELTKIIRKNYGPFWSVCSMLGFSLARLLPFVRMLRPIR
jgi:glycosyltransferase involved in cell wall biosynthesis